MIVSPRRWFRQGSSATAETQGEPRIAIRTEGPRGGSGSTPGRRESRRPRTRRARAADEGAGKTDPVHQPVLLARSCLDGPAPDRPGRIDGRERGYECHVLCSQGRYQPGEPKPPAFEVHEGVRIHRVPATSLGRRGTWPG